MGLQLWGRPDHCIVANNTIFANGRGLVVGGDENRGINDYTVVANNIVYKNLTLGVYESGLVGSHNRYIHNVVYGNLTDWFLKAVTLQATIASDPQFVHYTGDLDGDYHLGPGSPAIGVGDAEFAPFADFDSNPRGQNPSAGAYEFNSRFVR